ncbi:MAG: VOC family protein [Candidatus Thiodiazotropha sp. 6PLUC5]
MGSAYGHIALGVENCTVACKDIAAKGGEVIFGPSNMDGLDEIIAFIRDPDGYQIELIERSDY